MTPTREQLIVAADDLLCVGKPIGPLETLTARFNVSEFLRSVPLETKRDEIFSLLSKLSEDGYEPSVSIDLHPGFKVTNPETWFAHYRREDCVSGEGFEDLRDKLIALIKERNIDDAVDMATHPLSVDDWVEVIGRSVDGHSTIIGPWQVKYIEQSGDVATIKDGLQGHTFPRSSIRGPISAPVTP